MADLTDEQFLGSTQTKELSDAEFFGTTQQPQQTIIPRSGAQMESLGAREFLQTQPGEVRGTGNKPLIPIPRIPQQQGTVAQIGAGLVNAGASVAEMFETPQMIAALPVAPLRLTQALFGGLAVKDIPEAYRETTDYSQPIQQRVQGAGRLLTDILFGAAIAKGITRPHLSETAATEEVIKNASQEPSATGVPVSEVREKVGGEAPLRQQGETAQARQTQEEAIVEAAFRTPNGQIVRTGGLHGQPEGHGLPSESEAGFMTNTGRFVGREEAGQIATGRRQALFGEDFYNHPDIAKGGGVYSEMQTPVPQPEQPRILSTAVETNEGLKTGETWNQPHEEIQKGVEEPKRGFIIQEPDGTTRFTTDRSEAAGIAKEAGQVKPEFSDTSELHSQQLQEAQPVPAATEPTTGEPLPETGLPKTEGGATPPAVADFTEHPSAQALGIVPRPSEFVRQDVARVFNGISKGFKQIKAALTPANVSPVAGQTARIVREHAGQLAREREIAATSLQDAAQALRRNTPAQNLGIIDRLEKGQSLGNKALDDYSQIRKAAYDQRIKQVQDINPNALQDLIENYFPHIWTRESVEKLHGNVQNIPADNPWAAFFGKRPLAGRGTFLKQRSIPTTAEGVAIGLEPVTTNPVALDLLKMHEMDRYVMGHKIMQEMKDNGLAKFVPAGERPDFGHIQIDDRIARVYGPKGWKIVDEEGRQMPGQKVLGGYYAPEDAARVINNYLSPGLRGNAIYDAFRFVGNAMNQVQLGISAYHAFFTAIDSATSTIALGLEQIARSGGSASEIAKGAGQVAKGFVETPVGSMIENLWRGNKFLREYSRPGTSNAELAKIVDTAVSGGARVKMDTFYNTGAVNSFFDALKSGNYGGAILRAPLAAIQTVAKPLMEYAVPRMKLGIISQQLEFELSKLPKNATRDQVRTVAARVVDSVDNRMGQLIYDNLFWKKTLKDGLMASVRSVGWNLGDIRELGGGALDSITAPKRAYDALTKGTEIAGNPVFTKRMAYTFALPFYVGTLGSIYQYLMTGKGPQSVQDMFMPRTGRKKPDGSDERVMLPTYMKDVYPLALAAGREGITGLVSRGYRMAVNKLHPALSSIGQMIHNQDYYGNQILSPDDPLIQQHPTMGKIYREAEFLAKQFQPFSFRGVGQREGGIKEKAQAVAGIMPAPRELTDTPAMRMIHDINMSKRPSGGYTKLQQQKREDRRKAQQGQDLRPTLFKRLSNEEKARVMEAASPEERAIFQSATSSSRDRDRR